MISIRDVALSFGGEALLEKACWQINAGDRFALVGPNGSGKSTLFRMILGEVEPDRGAVQVKKGIAIGYLPQENAPLSEETVLAATLAELDDLDGKLGAKAKAILMGLGFKIADFEKPLRELSGGWAMRVAMAKLLLREPDVLLLDEPTNHLDLWSLLWFRDYLQRYQGTVVVISHDRAFINTVCHAVVSIEESTLRIYHGDYEYFVDQRAAERARLEIAYRAQQKQIAQMQEFINRNRARLSTARRAQSTITRLDRLERITLPRQGKEIHIQLPQPVRGGKEVVTLKNLHKSYGKVRVFRGLNFIVQRGARMAFVGPNGAGKSTLLKLLAGVLPFEEGERRLGYQVTVGYHSQHRAETMDLTRTVLDEAMAGEQQNPSQLVRDVLGSFLFSGGTVFKKVKVLSGGEKSRLSLVKILLNPPNFLLLDEPTTHLDMESVEALLAALKTYQGSLAFISHDEHFLNSLAQQIVYFKNGVATVYPGNFELFQWRQKQKEPTVS